MYHSANLTLKSVLTAEKPIASLAYSVVSGGRKCPKASSFGTNPYDSRRRVRMLSSHIATIEVGRVYSYTYTSPSTAVVRDGPTSHHNMSPPRPRRKAAASHGFRGAGYIQIVLKTRSGVSQYLPLTADYAGFSMANSTRYPTNCNELPGGVTGLGKWLAQTVAKLSCSCPNR